MKIKNLIVVRMPLYSRSRDYYLGKDVKLYTDRVCVAMILFLAQQFLKNPDCLIGDIKSLFRRKKQIDALQLTDNITYLEHLQILVRNAVYSLPEKNK